MVELSIQIQQHQQVAQLSRVTNLVQVAIIARIDFILFRLARIRKVLLKQSLVRYESLTLMFMHCYIQGLIFLLQLRTQQSNSMSVCKLSHNHSQTILQSVTQLQLDGYTEIALSQSLRKSPQQIQQSQKWQTSLSLQAWIGYTNVMPQSIVELGLFVFSFQMNQSQSGRVVAQRLCVNYFLP